MKSDLEKEIRRLQNLRQNKNRDVSEIEREAQLTVWKRQIDIIKQYSVYEEQILAESKFDAYLQNFTFIDYHEISSVANLIYEEILLQRVKNDINTISADLNSKYISDKLIDSLHKIEDRVIDLKLKLGIIKTKEKDDLTALQTLDKKFDVYISFNRNEFSCGVPYECSKCGHKDFAIYLFRRRVKNFDVLKHPVFAGRFLYNVEIFDDVRAGLITNEQAAKYLRTSPKYIEWALKHENKIITISGINKEKIDKFVNEKPYLRNAEEYNER